MGRGENEIRISTKENGSEEIRFPGVLIKEMLYPKSRVNLQGCIKGMIGQFPHKSPVLTPKRRGTRASAKPDMGFNVIQNTKHTLASMRI